MAYSGSSIRDLESDGWEITETFHRQGSVAEWHEHDAPHFCLVVAGGLVDECRDTDRECGPGALLYFPARTPHRDRFLDGGARCLNLRPPRGSAGSGGADPNRAGTPGDGSPGILLCEPRASWLASRLYDRIRIEAPRAHPRGRELADLLAARRADRPAEDTRPPAWLVRARELIEEGWTDDARLGTIAARVGVSRFHLARRFRERFGCSVGEYVHRLRVTHARHLLLSTDASLSEIAFATGFSDQSHFTRVFGRFAGTSPARYRDAA